MSQELDTYYAAERRIIKAAIEISEAIKTIDKKVFSAEALALLAAMKLVVDAGGSANAVAIDKLGATCASKSGRLSAMMDVYCSDVQADGAVN